MTLPVPGKNPDSFFKAPSSAILAMGIRSPVAKGGGGFLFESGCVKCRLRFEPAINAGRVTMAASPCHMRPPCGYCLLILRGVSGAPSVAPLRFYRVLRTPGDGGPLYLIPIPFCLLEQRAVRVVEIGCQNSFAQLLSPLCKIISVHRPITR
jgi:hypothetical protein